MRKVRVKLQKLFSLHFSTLSLLLDQIRRLIQCVMMILEERGSRGALGNYSSFSAILTMPRRQTSSFKNILSFSLAPANCCPPYSISLVCSTSACLVTSSDPYFPLTTSSGGNKHEAFRKLRTTKLLKTKLFLLEREKPSTIRERETTQKRPFLSL